MTIIKPERANDRNANGGLSEPLQAIATALDGMRYGAIQLIVHDGKPVQLEITERRRFGA